MNITLTTPTIVSWGGATSNRFHKVCYIDVPSTALSNAGRRLFFVSALTSTIPQRNTLYVGPSPTGVLSPLSLSWVSSGDTTGAAGDFRITDLWTAIKDGYPTLCFSGGFSDASLNHLVVPYIGYIKILNNVAPAVVISQENIGAAAQPYTGGDRPSVGGRFPFNQGLVFDLPVQGDSGWITTRARGFDLNRGSVLVGESGDSWGADPQNDSMTHASLDQFDNWVTVEAPVGYISGYVSRINRMGFPIEGDSVSSVPILKHLRVSPADDVKEPWIGYSESRLMAFSPDVDEDNVIRVREVANLSVVAKMHVGGGTYQNVSWSSGDTPQYPEHHHLAIGWDLLMEDVPDYPPSNMRLYGGLSLACGADASLDIYSGNSTWSVYFDLPISCVCCGYSGSLTDPTTIDALSTAALHNLGILVVTDYQYFYALNASELDQSSPFYGSPYVTEVSTRDASIDIRSVSAVFLHEDGIDFAGPKFPWGWWVINAGRMDGNPMQIYVEVLHKTPDNHEVFVKDITSELAAFHTSLGRGEKLVEGDSYTGGYKSVTYAAHGVLLSAMVLSVMSYDEGGVAINYPYEVITTYDSVSLSFEVVINDISSDSSWDGYNLSGYDQAILEDNPQFLRRVSSGVFRKLPSGGVPLGPPITLTATPNPEWFGSLPQLSSPGNKLGVVAIRPYDRHIALRNTDGEWFPVMVNEFFDSSSLWWYESSTGEAVPCRVMEGVNPYYSVLNQYAPTQLPEISYKVSSVVRTVKDGLWAFVKTGSCSASHLWRSDSAPTTQLPRPDSVVDVHGTLFPIGLFVNHTFYYTDSSGVTHVYLADAYGDIYKASTNASDFPKFYLVSSYFHMWHDIKLTRNNDGVWIAAHRGKPSSYPTTYYGFYVSTDDMQTWEVLAEYSDVSPGLSFGLDDFTPINPSLLAPPTVW